MAKIWAHRGASKRAPENTLQAFRLAVDEGADGIELDVHLCKDGIPVVVHDDTVDRTFNGSGYVEDMTLAELKALENRKGSGAETALPTFEEALDFIKPTGLLVNIELKTGRGMYEGMEQKLLELVARKGMEGRVMYSSFNHYALAGMKQAAGVKIGLLYMAGIVQPWLYAQRINADAIHPFYPSLMVPDLVKDSRDAGVEVNVWTVDDAQTMALALKLGVDGIITNLPAEAAALRGE